MNFRAVMKDKMICRGNVYWTTKIEKKVILLSILAAKLLLIDFFTQMKSNTQGLLDQRIFIKKLRPF